MKLGIKHLVKFKKSRFKTKSIPSNSP